MKKIIGLDVATKTGWSLLEVDDNNNISLKEFGTIQIPSSFTDPQKLNFLNIEIKRLVERLKPDYASVENAIMGMSGVKILIYLARLNGVAIQSLFETLKDNVQLYEPMVWRKNSFPSIAGGSKKWEVQLAVCKHFNLTTSDNYAKWDSFFTNLHNRLEETKDKFNKSSIELKKVKQCQMKKKKPEGYNEQYIAEIISKMSKEVIELKLAIKNFKRTTDKEMMKVSDDICAQTGISNDIADSIGLAYCLAKKLTNAK